MNDRKPATAKPPVLARLCKLIPTHLTASLAKKPGIDKQARTFSAWSHVVTPAAQGKPPTVIMGAVITKLLHIICGVPKHGQPFHPNHHKKAEITP